MGDDKVQAVSEDRWDGGRVHALRPALLPEALYSASKKTVGEEMARIKEALILLAVALAVAVMLAGHYLILVWQGVRRRL